MNRRSTASRVGLLVALALPLAWSLTADEPKPAAAAATTTNSAPVSSAEVKAAAAEPLVPAEAAMLDLSASEAAGNALTSQSQATAQTRLKAEPVKPLSERGGAIRFIVREPKAGNVLNLVNPFAPTSLGAGGATHNPWKPFEGGKSVPRAFIDDKTHEASGVLLSW